MARDHLASDFSEIMSDATTCSCNTNSIGKCSLQSCGMFHEPFFLHPPTARPRDGIYINPMGQFLSESPQQKQNDNNNSFYLHSPHELVYTRITRLFCDNVVNKARRNGIDRKDDTLTVKVDVHINNNNNNNNGNYKTLSNGGSIKSEIIIKEGSVDHAYEQIYIKPDELLDKKHSDDSSESCRSRTNARRFSRSSSGSESSSQMSSEIHYSSAVSTPSLSRNSSNESIQKTTLKPPELPERKILTPPIVVPETNLKIPIIIPCVTNPPPPPPPLPPPPPPTQAAAVDEIAATPKIIEAEKKDTSKNESELFSSSSAINKHEPTTSPEQQQQEVVESCISTSGDNSKTSQVSHLVNKHMVLPFIPPKFTNAADSNGLLKPSEYLRSICKASGKNTLSKARSVDNLDFRGTVSSREVIVVAGEAKEADECQVTKIQPGPPPPPLPPQNHHPPILPARSASVAAGAAASTPTTEKPRTPQPLATISIQDLTSVQLRRTNVKMHAAKTFSAPPPARSVSMTNVSEPFFVQKTDLIAELKMTRDIPGIKKFKVEMAKVEKTQEKNFMSEISKAFNVSNFVDQIPEKDSSGNVIPIWKRQMLARKAAERAKKELEEQIARENEEKRQKAIPPWKRQLLAKKDSLDPEKKVAPAPLIVAPAPVKIDKNDVSTAAPAVAVIAAAADDDDNDDNNNKDNNDKENDDDDDDDDGTAIIPWRAQLRKTNSKLNILD